MERDDELQHWGVKGMEWKHHKKKKKNDDIKDRLRSLIKKAESRVHKGEKKVSKSAHKVAKSIKDNTKIRTKTTYEVIDLKKTDHIGNMKRDRKAEAMFKSKKFQNAYKKHEQAKAHEQKVSKVNGKITKYGSLEKKLKLAKKKEAEKAAKRRNLSNSVKDAFKEVGLVKKTKSDRLNDAFKEVGLKKKSTGEKIGEKTNNILKDLGIKKKSKAKKVADEISSEAGIQYELAKAKAYQKIHNGESAPFDVTNKNQWKALARTVGLTKSPAQKAADKIKSKIKKRKKKTITTYMESPK